MLLFLDPGSEIRDPGSGMGKNQDPGSGIKDKHPGSATLVVVHNLYLVIYWIRTVCLRVYYLQVSTYTTLYCLYLWFFSFYFDHLVNGKKKT